MNQLEAEIDLCADLRSKLDAALADDCPLGQPRRRVHPRRLSRRRWTPCASWPTAASSGSPATRPQESQRTGIPTLKVGFNKVFGYYIEVTNAHREKIPADYIRKQTVKNAERYITPELKEYEEKVLTADEKAKELEYELFLELRDAVAAARRRMQATAAVLAAARRAGGAGRAGPAAELLPAGDRRGAGAADRRRPAPGARRRSSRKGRSCPTT